MRKPEYLRPVEAVAEKRFSDFGSSSTSDV